MAHRIVLYTEATSRGGAEVSLKNLAATLDPALDVVIMGVDDGICEWLASARPSARAIVVPPVKSKFAVGPFFALRRELAALNPAIFQATLRELSDARHALMAASMVRGILPIAVEQLALLRAAPTTWWLKGVVSRRVAAHVAVGDHVARFVERATRLPNGTVRTIYNGVPDLGPAARRTGDGRVVLGSLARLDRIKGLDVLFDAMSDLSATSGLIAGEGPERATLLAQANELGLRDRISLVPWSDTVRDLFADIDIFVLPSRAEGFPLSIVEAMLAGRPVVATDVGSVSEAVVDKVTGFVVPPNDVSALRTALERLVTDPELRTRMGAAGRERALAHFTAEKMARAFEHLYDEIDPPS